MSETTGQQTEATIPAEQPPPGDVSAWAEAVAASTEAQAEEAPARKTVRRLCKQRLTDAAMRDLASTFAQEQFDLDALKALVKSENARWREERSAVELKIKSLAEAIRSGTSVVEQECYERFDPDTNCTELVALDGTILEAADVPADKRQLTLADAARNGSNGHAAAPFAGSTCASCDVPLTEENGRRDSNGDSLCIECHDREAAADVEGEDPDADPADAPLDGDEPSGELPAWAKETTHYEGRKVDDDDEPSAGDTVIVDPAAVLAAADADTSADAPAPKRARGRKAKG